MGSTQATKDTKPGISFPKLSTNEGNDQVREENHRAEFHLELNWEEVEFKSHESWLQLYRSFREGLEECVPDDVHPGSQGKAWIIMNDKMKGLYEVIVWTKPDQVLKDYKNH